MNTTKITPEIQAFVNEIYTVISTDHVNFMKIKLEYYKEKPVTREEFSQWRGFNVIMSNMNYAGYSALLIKDKDEKMFLTVAIEKGDIDIVEFLVKCDGYHIGISKPDYHRCLNICIEKMKEYNQETVNLYVKILNILITTRFYNVSTKPDRLEIVKKLILLQLQQRKDKLLFNLTEDFFVKLLVHGRKDDPIVLTELYKTMTDDDQYTLAHQIVDRQLPDELYTLIKKNYVPEEHLLLTLLKLAFRHYQMYTQDPTLCLTQKEEFQRSKCCLFMLLQHIGLQQGNTGCCEKHKLDTMNTVL